MKLSKGSGPEPFLSSIRAFEVKMEELSAHWFEIVDERDSLAGMCVISPGLSQGKRKAIKDGINGCEGLSVSGGPPSDSSACRISLLPRREDVKKTEAENQVGYDYFHKNLLAVSTQATTTRIPFAVLLIGIDSPSPSREELSDTMAKIRKGLNPDEIFSCIVLANKMETVKGGMFAVIIPSCGLSKARRRAEEIRKSVLAEVRIDEEKKCRNKSISIGFGVSYAGDRVSLQDFYSSVEKNLNRALAIGDSIYWDKVSREVNSCQVTAEERSHLFGLLK